jgi:hypothetical protein
MALSERALGVAPVVKASAPGLFEPPRREAAAHASFQAIGNAGSTADERFAHERDASALEEYVAFDRAALVSEIPPFGDSPHGRPTRAPARLGAPSVASADPTVRAEPPPAELRPERALDSSSLREPFRVRSASRDERFAEPFVDPPVARPAGPGPDARALPERGARSYELARVPSNDEPTRVAAPTSREARRAERDDAVLASKPSDPPLVVGVRRAPLRPARLAPAEYHVPPGSEFSSGVPEPSPKRQRRARSDSPRAFEMEAAPLAEAPALAAPGRLPWSSDFTVDGSEVEFPAASPAVVRERHPGPHRALAHPKTLHVTIGRLEIRATSLELPAPSRRQESPRMTLDAYLAARAGRQG